MEWRWFTIKQEAEAQKYLANGGIIVRQMNHGHGKETGILSSLSLDVLVKSGAEIHLNSKWLRKKGCTPHYELKGEPLRKAKRNCVNFKD